MNTLRFTAIFPLCLLAGCANLAPSNCPEGSQTWVREEVFFGTDKPGGKVSTEDWADFLGKSVTPRFPQGLTVWPASGQWRDEQGKIVREESYVLTLVHSGDTTTEAAVKALTRDYRQRFQQEAVLRVRSSACVSF
ncbi:MAG: DUF3574 domain-containing protein [Betaproteobacteria bacterium]|nr:DUF3574 domain-containing protein [Betaproteobacteria bacterium]